MVSPPEKGELKEAREEEKNIIMSISKLRNIIPLQLNNMSAKYRVMCGCECCISAKSTHSLLLSQRYCYMKNLKTKSIMS